MKDLLGKELELGDLVAALPETTARVLVKAKITEIHDKYVTLEYEDRLFNDRITTSSCFPDSMVLVGKFEYPDVCHGDDK